MITKNDIGKKTIQHWSGPIYVGQITDISNDGFRFTFMHKDGIVTEYNCADYNVAENVVAPFCGESLNRTDADMSQSLNKDNSLNGKILV